MIKVPTEAICKLARVAGAAIMEFYDGEYGVEYKNDNSPVTAADKAAHEVIVAGLRGLTPDIPVLSEEGRDISYEQRKEWDRFWLVDPLDGTKEFIKHNGEFTVNIALIEGQRPAFGVVYAPVQDILYWGGKGQGAFRQKKKNAPEAIHVRKTDSVKGLTVLMSRSHPSPGLKKYLKTIPVAEALSVGSSLKFCAVAEGRADLYPRLGPTMEWDTGAGQAVVEGAGGTVTCIPASGPLQYNKISLLNPHFEVCGVDIDR